MIKIVLFIILGAINVLSIEIDYKTLEEIIAQDEGVIRERVLLAKYYTKEDNNLKALNLLKEVLDLDPENKNALGIKKKIELKERVKRVCREAGLSYPVDSKEAQKRLDSYYLANNYQFYSNLYQALLDIKIKLNDSYHIKAAYIYLWDSRYKESENAINQLHQENNIDAAKIQADICYYSGKYHCSVRLYEKLYNSSYEIKTAIKLINSYIYIGETTKAQRLYNFIYRKNSTNKELAKLGEKIDSSKNSYLLNMKKKYEEEKTFQTLSSYANALYSAGKKSEAIRLIHKYNEEFVSNNSLVLEAKYLIWEGNTDGALDILKHGSLNNDLQAKLMLGQIYSWEAKFEASKKNLDEVLIKAEDKNLLYDAKKARAYVYMWEKHSKEASESFQKLLQQRPNDKEVIEALMELNHDYAGLIQKYETKLGSTNTKRLAELYTLNKEPKMAIKYLKKYVKENPTDLEATKNLGVMLVDNKEYYEGFGYLEYYSAQKQDAKSSLLLAKYYYWHAFSKEALDVLEALLEKEPENKEALELKAKILKVSPRFTTSNSGATTGMYFDDLAKKQLFLADTLYFNAHYKASLTYYEHYLESHPNDHDVRFRYSFALENAKEYGKAEGEFSLLFWSKDSDELRYHYAYNMMKNRKLKESKKLLLKLKETVYTKLDVKLNKFLNSWKNSWESLDFKEYSSHYNKEFLKDEIWAFRKQAKFSNVSYISIGIYSPVSKKLGKNSYEIEFYQEYSTNKNSDKGYKVLEVECTEHKYECRITKERWHKGEFKKRLLLMPYIDRSLKENEYLKKHPLSLKSKKKSLRLNQPSIMIYT